MTRFGHKRMVGVEGARAKVDCVIESYSIVKIRRRNNMMHYTVITDMRITNRHDIRIQSIY